jgi:PAS domain S-box-containing protein
MSERNSSRPLRSPRARRDLLIALVILAVIFLLTIRFDLSERAQDWTAQHEGWELDEIFVLSLAASVVMGIYAWRRMSDFQHEAEQRAIVEQSLRESERRYRAIAEDQLEYIYRFRPDGTTLYANESCLQFLHMRAEDLPSTLFRPEAWGQYRDEILEKLVALEKGDQNATFTHSLTQDGEVRWYEWTIRVIRSDSGDTVEYQAVGRDITERKRAQKQELQLALEREKVAMLSGFIRDASHEFRTPLAVISAGLDLAEHLSARGENIGGQVHVLQEQVTYLSGLVNALLTMSHLDTVWTFNPDLRDLNAVVNGAVDRVQADADAKHQTLKIDLADELPPVGMDAEVLRQALVNILQNAVIYTPEGGTIKVRTFRRDEYAVAEVRDTGVGIDPASLPLIFERFYRADPARTGRHAGMGLAIAKRIIEAHSGQIEVESFPGSGSMFRVVLPLPIQVEAGPTGLKVFV